MEASHMWWSDPRTDERHKTTVRQVLQEIEKFADNSGLRHSRKFVRR